MTNQQVVWASQHDWYVSFQDGRVWVRSDRPEGGILPFSNFHKLKVWAGY